MDILYKNSFFVKYLDLKKSIRQRKIYDTFDKYGYVSDLFMAHYLQMQNMDRKKKFVGKNIKFLDLCSSPGGFSNYVLRKSKENTGVGISLNISKGGIANMIDSKRYEFHYGDIIQDNKKIVDILNKREFDLISHGCHDMTEEKEFYKNEYAELKLWMTAFKLGITHLKSDGIFLFKASLKYERFLFNLLNFLANYFEEFDFVKSDFMHNIRSSFFIICKKPKTKNTELIDEFLNKINSKDKSLKLFHDVLNVDKIDMGHYINLLVDNVVKVQYKAIKQFIKMVDDMKNHDHDSDITL